ncbi:hypothetical protein KZZ52_24935 [Dactylosporangium sp. AC04546]|uniref:hypothetical protein n=1 Tax=Dactylosporangium sp. AC04546 TaxID=2862460 RepID=UPI001EDDC824|nr:hypothetical protein [Dactylosporangium sp. AC04546]WVK88517.1 hypothetical protein KZZ52_24935 [Dactylosporangium sp. AC04546]
MTWLKLVVFGVLAGGAAVGMFLLRLVPYLFLAALATLPAFSAWVYFDTDRQYARGVHGTMTVRTCAKAAEQWRCSGPFLADDGRLAVDKVDVMLDKRPGELVEGWVRGPDEDMLKPAVQGWGPRWELVSRWIAVVVAAVGGLVAAGWAAWKGFKAGWWVWDKLCLHL